jgi:hypothetical protein
MIDCYVTENHPMYQVWVNGAVVKTMWANESLLKRPLTYAQQADIAAGFREAYDD